MDVMKKLGDLLRPWPVYLSLAVANNFVTNCVTIQEWISVKDRLPIEEAKVYEKDWCEKYPEFLVMIEGGLLPTTLYYDWRENEWFDGELETYKVTHWLPLPARPKGE